MSLKKVDEKFKQNILNLLQRINESNSMLKSDQELLKHLIRESNESENKYNYLLSVIEENIKQKIHLKEQIRILPMLIESNTRISVNLPKILGLLNLTMIDEHNKFSSNFADSFGSIVLNCWKQTLFSEEDKKEAYEYLQSFCLNNLKQESKYAQVCGSLCLSRLIENCPLILAKNNINSIWENIMTFLEKSNFAARSELLDTLISLIFAVESLFKPYATITLYKVLDFITDNDWIKRKLAIDIIYTLANYSPKEVLPLKYQIIDFLSALKTDKVKQVREACNITLKYLRDTNFELEGKHEIFPTTESHGDEIKRTNGNENEVAKASLLNTKFDIKSLENSFSALVTLNNKEINDEDRSRSKHKNKATLNKKLKTIVTKNIETKEKKKNTRNTIKPISTISKIAFTGEDIDEPYLKTDYNVIKRKDSYKKSKSKLGKVNLSKDIECKGNEKIIRNFTPTRLSNKKKLSKTPEKDPYKSKEKTAFFKAVNKNNMPKEDIKRENSHSIFKGPVNKEFFNNVINENGTMFNNQSDGIQIILQKKESENSPTSQINTTNFESKDMLSKSFKNRDFPLMITKKAEKEGDSKKKETSVNKDDKKEEVKEINITKSIEITKENKNDLNNIGSPVEGEFKGQSLLMKDLHLLSEKQMELIETVKELKNFTTENISIINGRLERLENFMIGFLENHRCENTIQNTLSLNNLMPKNCSKIVFSPKNIKERVSSNSLNNHSNIDVTWNEILLNLKKNNINEAIILSNRNDNYLIKLTTKISIVQIKEVSQNLLKEVINKLLNFLQKNEHVKQIISFIRRVLLEANIELMPKLYIKIKESMINIASSNKCRLSSEETLAIREINTYISEKMIPSKTSSHSPLIQSFATDLNIDSSYHTNIIHTKTNKK